MRTKKGEKDKLKVTILDRAISFFKENGSGGSGINAVMEHAGLTTGALYSHFKSKDDLFGEAVCRELEKLEFANYQILKKEKGNALKVMIDLYFDEKNFIEIGDGCVFTALGTDMHRCKASYRERFEAHIEKVYEAFAESIQLQFPDESPEACYAKATVVLSGMVGAMTMARAVKNQKTAHAILANEKEHLLRNFCK